MILQTYIYIDTEWNEITTSTEPTSLLRRRDTEIILRTRQVHNEPMITLVVKVNNRFYSPNRKVDIGKDMTIINLGAIPKNFAARLTTIINTSPNKESACH